MTRLMRESARLFYRIVVQFSDSCMLDKTLVLGIALCAVLMASGCSENASGPSPIPTPPAPATPTPTPLPPAETPTPTPTPATPTPTPATPTPTPIPAAFQVTEVAVSAEPATYNGSCPKVVKFEGSIKANGAGRVEYRWESESGTGTPMSYDFAQAGVKYVDMTQTLSNSKSGWIRLRILSPNNVVSNKANFDVECRGSVTELHMHTSPKTYFGS
jgi:hypothetical protein